MFLTTEQVMGIGFRDVGANILIDAAATFIMPDRISIGNNVRIDAWSVLGAGNDGIMNLGMMAMIGKIWRIDSNETMRCC